MINIIVTAYGEPKATEQSINALLNQETITKLIKQLSEKITAL